MPDWLSQLLFWHWFALAITLAIFDVLFGANFLFVWCGLSAALVGVLKFIFPGMIWEYQLLIFGIGMLASLVVWRQYVKHRATQSLQIPTLNRRAEQYIGRIFTLHAAIENGRGKVKVDDSLWQVTGEEMPIGTKVRVIAVEGIVLKVEKN